MSSFYTSICTCPQLQLLQMVHVIVPNYIHLYSQCMSLCLTTEIRWCHFLHICTYSYWLYYSSFPTVVNSYIVSEYTTVILKGKYLVFTYFYVILKMWLVVESQ
jgi:hypothetical protein